jgi:hypothetical protein
LIARAVKHGSAVVTISGYLSGQEGLEDTIFIPKPVAADDMANAIVRAQMQAGLRAKEPLAETLRGL